MTAQEFFQSWYHYFDEKALKDAVAKVKPLYESRVVYPDYKRIFDAFKYCRYEDLKVVMLGMDPYNDGSATGIAFANDCGKTLSPSLQIIKKCLEECYDTTNFDPTLISWAKQGVLLLNSALTVEAHAAGSHTMLWRKFISSFLRNLSSSNTGLVYVLFGKQAQTFEPYIRSQFNTVIKCSHPAYYARTGTEMPCIFKDIDKITMLVNGVEIDWGGVQKITNENTEGNE